MTHPCLSRARAAQRCLAVRCGRSASGHGLCVSRRSAAIDLLRNPDYPNGHAGRNASVKLKVYLDTSVFSALLDSRNPVRQQETRDLFERLDAFESSTSEAAREELMRTPDATHREELVAFVPFSPLGTEGFPV